jgi:hypothetical protein
MQDYLKEFKILLDQLMACGSKIGKKELQTYILNGLPPTFDVFATLIRTRGVPITLSKLESLLVCEELNKYDQASK